MKTLREQFKEASGIDKMSGVEQLMTDNISGYLYWLECKTEAVLKENIRLQNDNKCLVENCFTIGEIEDAFKLSLKTLWDKKSKL